MPLLELPGCTPEPLMNYLKALGVFRLVAEQADPSAKLSWRGGVAVLNSRFNREQLLKFFLAQYEPTPILAPWNGGSGFYGGGAEPLVAIDTSDAKRLKLYRETIANVRSFVPANKPKDELKVELLTTCRDRLSDSVIPWLDACFVLSEDGPSFFPLLGTGGNDGRLDFTNNFMQRLAEVISYTDEDAPNEDSRNLLAAALYADTLVSLGKSAVGQFNPGGIGGANGTQGRFEAGSRVNPWEFVLMVEGVLLFAGSIARRMGVVSSSRAVFPFTVESIAVGYGSATASEETTDGSRAELWLPIWNDGCTLGEVRFLFAEGRAQLGRRQAKNAVEFALAINLLGVSRGVKSFVRYGFLKRNGLAFLAAPLGHVAVNLRPKARLLTDHPLAEWIDHLRRACSDKDKTPSRYQSVLRQIDKAIFAFASRSEQSHDAKHLLAVLCAIGRAERTLATEGLSWLKDKQYGWKLRPLTGLNSEWLDQANDNSPEFRLATALAGIGFGKEIGPLRAFLEEVEVTKFVNWAPGSTSAVWSKQPLALNLAAVFRRRQMEALRNGEVGVPLDSPRPAPLSDVIAFLNDEIDGDKLHDLLWGLICVEFPNDFIKPESNEAKVPFEFGVPRLLVQENCFLPKGDCWHLVNDKANAKPEPDVFDVLSSGGKTAVEQCLTRASRRLKSGGLLVHGYRNRQHSGKPFMNDSSVRPERLLAAMLFPLSDRDLERIANSVLFPPESKE